MYIFAEKIVFTSLLYIARYQCFQFFISFTQRNARCGLNILYKVEQNFTSKIREHILNERYVFLDIKIFYIISLFFLKCGVCDYLHSFSKINQYKNQMPLKKCFPFAEITSCLQNLLQERAKNKMKKKKKYQKPNQQCSLVQSRE